MISPCYPYIIRIEEKVSLPCSPSHAIMCLLWASYQLQYRPHHCTQHNVKNHGRCRVALCQYSPSPKTLSPHNYLPLGQPPTTSSDYRGAGLGLAPSCIPSRVIGTAPCPISHRTCGHPGRPGRGACAKYRPAAVPAWPPTPPSPPPSLL